MCKSRTLGCSTRNYSWSPAFFGDALATTRCPSPPPQLLPHKGPLQRAAMASARSTTIRTSSCCRTTSLRLPARTLCASEGARAWRDTDFSTAGMNGSYLFNCSLASQCSASYQSATPAQYSATVIENPVARALLFDGALFLQDDWHINHSFLLGLGHALRRPELYPRPRGLGTAHRPRSALGHPGKNQQQKTVIRAGYGWFFNRFIMNTAFSSGSEPYIITAIHDNRINQQSYVVKNPNSVFPAPDQFDPNQPATIPASTLSSAAISVPAYHTVDPHFHAALDMQGGIGVDRQITKHITGNVTYLYTQGVHQYMTNNATAPTFDLSDYTITGPTPTCLQLPISVPGVLPPESADLHRGRPAQKAHRERQLRSQ